MFKAFMNTKVNDLRVKEVFVYIAMLFAFIYGPLYAMLWIAEHCENKRKKLEQKKKDDDFADKCIDDVWEAFAER